MIQPHWRLAIQKNILFCDSIIFIRKKERDGNRFSEADRVKTRGLEVSEDELRHHVRPRPGGRRDLLQHLRDREGVVEEEILLAEDPLDDDAVVGQDGRVRVRVQREERSAGRKLKTSGSG